MTQVEYKVIPAPRKGLKAPGIKKPEDRFARTLEDMMNEMARDGWHYLRADMLPSDERSGLTSSQTVYRSVLVFERRIEADEKAAPAHTPADPPLTASRNLPTPGEKSSDVDETDMDDAPEPPSEATDKPTP